MIYLFPPVPAVCINPTDALLFPLDLGCNITPPLYVPGFGDQNGELSVVFGNVGMWLESLDHAVVKPECCKSLVILH